MKTNITLLSGSRNLFGTTIRQTTQNGFLNLSDLQSAYSVAREEFGWAEKRIDHILPQIENRERVFYILEETQSINVDRNTFMKNCDQIGFYKYLKQLGVYKTTGRGSNKSTVCNPYLWVLAAMELNPRIYAKVALWLTDRLILNRLEAGDMYKNLASAIKTWPDVDYSLLGRALNIVVFGRHETGIRNTASEAELKELRELESNLAFSVESGLICSFDELISHVRRVWHKKREKALA